MAGPKPQTQKARPGVSRGGHWLDRAVRREFSDAGQGLELFLDRAPPRAICHPNQPNVRLTTKTAIRIESGTAMNSPASNNRVSLSLNIRPCLNKLRSDRSCEACFRSQYRRHAIHVRFGLTWPPGERNQFGFPNDAGHVFCNDTGGQRIIRLVLHSAPTKAFWGQFQRRLIESLFSRSEQLSKSPPAGASAPCPSFVRMFR